MRPLRVLRSESFIVVFVAREKQIYVVLIERFKDGPQGFYAPVLAGAEDRMVGVGERTSARVDLQIVD